MYVCIVVIGNKIFRILIEEVVCLPLFVYENKTFKQRTVSSYILRTNVTNSQTFGGNSSNIDFVHILQLDKP